MSVQEPTASEPSKGKGHLVSPASRCSLQVRSGEPEGLPGLSAVCVLLRLTRMSHWQAEAEECPVTVLVWA